MEHSFVAEDDKIILVTVIEPVGAEFGVTATYRKDVTEEVTEALEKLLLSSLYKGEENRNGRKH